MCITNPYVYIYIYIYHRYYYYFDMWNEWANISSKKLIIIGIPMLDSMGQYFSIIIIVIVMATWRAIFLFFSWGSSLLITHRIDSPPLDWFDFFVSCSQPVFLICVCLIHCKGGLVLKVSWFFFWMGGRKKKLSHWQVAIIFFSLLLGVAKKKFPHFHFATQFDNNSFSLS